jgi:hypothetical protein
MLSLLELDFKFQKLQETLLFRQPIQSSSFTNIADYVTLDRCLRARVKQAFAVCT